MIRKNPPIERIAVGRIQLGERRRKKIDSKKLEALARSIEETFLIHPITLADDLTLVCGERRLEAVKDLGWASIPARLCGSPTDEERDRLEREENTQRTDLTAVELAKRELVSMEAEDDEYSDKMSEKSGKRGKGQPAKHGGGSKKDRDARGLKKKRLRSDIAAAEKYPFVDAKGWTATSIHTVETQLDAMSEKDATTLAMICNESGVPAKTALTIVGNASQMKPAVRKETLDLYRSEEPHKVSLSKTRLAQTPPQPPASLSLIRAAINKLETALDRPNTVGRGDIRSSISVAKSALKTNEESYQALRRKEGWD
jgi:ParB family chromosome partitioning protein